MIDPLPIYTPGFESYQDPLNKQYPLQLTGFHYKSRVHSTYGNVDVLKAACRQEMWINPLDAQKRGINNGDKVRIFNDRGEVHIEAKVTPRMMPVWSHWVKVPGMTRIQNVSIRAVVLTY